MTGPLGSDAPDSTELSAEILRQTGNRNLAEIMSIVGNKATAKPDLEFHQGRVIEWNSTTGTNQIFVLGSIMTDVPTLATGDNVLLFEGDTVAVLRYKYNYFVLGRIQSPGTNRSFGPRTSYSSGPGTVLNTSYTTSVFDPFIDNINIGSSQRALVFARATLSISGGRGDVGIRVEGPDGRWISGYTCMSLSTSSETVTNIAMLSGIVMFDPADPNGPYLPAGNNSIGLVYQVTDIGAAGVAFSAGACSIVVTPY